MISHQTLVFNMMNEKLQDKVIAIELAGNNIFIANDNDNFKNELISIGSVSYTHLHGSLPNAHGSRDIRLTA